MDFYEILGLSDSDKKLKGKEFEDVLKSKHRELIRKWHPDKWVNGTEEEKKTADEKTKEINEAYTTLSDPQKREEYDNMQSMGSGGGWWNPFAEDENFDPFENIRMRGGFGDFGHFGNFGKQAQNTVHYGEDVKVNVTITLQESYSGCTKNISYYRPTKCHSCNGTGAKDGKFDSCPHCGGSGRFVNTHRNGNQFFQQITICPHCGGSGKIASAKCENCNGTGFKQELRTIDITLPKGIYSGNVMYINEEGGESRDGGPNGRLAVVIDVENNTPFKVDDNRNLIYTVKKHYTDVLLGFKDSVPFIDGSNIKYSVPELSKDGYEVRFAGKGMPKLNNNGTVVGNGDLIVRIECIYPKKLTKKDKEAIASLKHD